MNPVSSKENRVCLWWKECIKEMNFPWDIDAEAFDSICKTYSFWPVIDFAFFFLHQFIFHIYSFKFLSNLRKFCFVCFGPTEYPLAKRRFWHAFKTKQWDTFASGSLGISAAACAVALALNLGVACRSLGRLDIASPLGDGLLLYLLMTSACLNNVKMSPHGYNAGGMMCKVLPFDFLQNLTFLI